MNVPNTFMKLIELKLKIKIAWPRRTSVKKSCQRKQTKISDTKIERLLQFLSKTLSLNFFELTLKTPFLIPPKKKKHPPSAFRKTKGISPSSAGYYCQGVQFSHYVSSIVQTLNIWLFRCFPGTELAHVFCPRNFRKSTGTALEDLLNPPPK